VIEPTVVDGSGTGGVRGLVNGWTYDASAGYGHNSFAFTIGDTLNVSLGPALPPNKTQFDAGTLELNQFVANLDVSRPFRVGGLPGPLNIAFGTEYRRENYQIQAGEPDSYRDGGALNQLGGPAAIGAQVFPGFRPSNEVNESRDSVAGYLDAEGNVLKWLRLGAAARAEHYSDFGGTLDGKLTVRVEPNRYVVLRGSTSTGFRAPSLGQSFFSSTATNFLNLGQGLVPVESLTLPVNSAPAQVLGAAPLKPENSTHLGGRVVITPIRALELTVDYYHIAIDDRIVLSGNFTAAPIAALLAPFGANSARFFTNAIDTRTSGVDATATYHLSLDAAGDLRLRAAYNNTQTKIVGSIATPPQLAGFESVLFDRIEQRRLECGQPKDNLRLQSVWQRNRIGANLDVSRYGEFCSFVTTNPADDQTFSPKWLTNLEATYRTSRYLLAAGAQNLFDVFPDRNSTVNSFNGIQTFPSQSPFGMNGRTLYARLGWTF
jgi:iron complex outermembrane recepter protein